MGTGNALSPAVGRSLQKGAGVTAKGALVLKAQSCSQKKGHSTGDGCSRAAFMGDVVTARRMVRNIPILWDFIYIPMGGC